MSLDRCPRCRELMLWGTCICIAYTVFDTENDPKLEDGAPVWCSKGAGKDYGWEAAAEKFTAEWDESDGDYSCVEGRELIVVVERNNVRKRFTVTGERVPRYSAAEEA